MINSHHHHAVSPEPAFRWSIELNGHPSGALEPQPGTMTAGEEMFFLGSPLAHVVDYEEVQRQKRFRALTGRCRSPADLDQLFPNVSQVPHKVAAE